MSYLLEILGRGRIGELGSLFGATLSPISDDELAELRRRAIDRPDDPGLHTRLGVARLQRFKVSEAGESFKRAIRLDPDMLAARLGLVCCLEQQDQLAEAIRQLELANTLAPGEPAVLLALAYCCERVGRQERAGHLYRDLLARCPNCQQARERLAAIELACGRVEQATDQYEELRAATGGGDARIRLCLGNLYLKSGRSADAVEEFAAAIALAPENWVARNELVNALLAEDRLVEAIEQIESLIASQPDRPELHVQLADVHARLGDDRLAVGHYAEALKLDGDCLEAAVKLATQHLRAGRLADAAIAFNRSVQISDRSLAAYVGLAVAQKNAGQLDRAADTLELASQIAPNSTLLFREMARLELKAGLARQAENEFTVAAAADHRAAGSGEPDEDWEQLLDYQIGRHRKAVAEHPNHADWHYRLGLLLAGQGDLHGAIEHYSQAVRINPNYAKARIKLGLALRDIGQPDRAIEELTAALHVGPQFADIHYRLGLLFADSGRLAEAADAFEQSLAINGESPEVRANLATCLETMGMLDRASEQWQLLAGQSDLLPAACDERTALVARRTRRP